MLHFSRFLFFINFQRHMHSICVWNMIEQSKPLQTWYDTTYISDIYYIRTHVYVFLFSVKKCVFELSRVWPWRWPCGCTPYVVYIGPVFHNSTVRLLTHVLCKPTHFFYHSFISIMSYSLQTSFNSVMKDWADKCHVRGTPTRSPSRSNSR